jgi:hypothetical protein
MQFKVLAIAMSLLTIAASAPFTLAETVAASPLGTIASNGSVTIGNTPAPTGTTIFSGDRVASVQPALVQFDKGSRVEMTKAAAVFSRQGKTIVVNADKGLLRFNFKKGESVQINAGKFQFAGGSESERIGELGMDGKGQLVMTMTAGRFEAVNTETGARAKFRRRSRSMLRLREALLPPEPAHPRWAPAALPQRWWPVSRPV